MDETKFIQLLVNGYIRKLESNKVFNLNIPKSLINIMIKLYPRSWKFVDRDYKKVIIGDDGLSVSITDSTYVTVQFGEFFSNKTKMIYKFRFKTGAQNHNGIGFITKHFKSFQRHDWNNGRNHSTIYYSNGYCVKSSSFKHVKCDWISGGWFSKNDEIIIKINTDKMKALIWNYSKLKIHDIEFKNYDQNDRYQQLMTLPKNTEIRLVIEMGFIQQSIYNIDQTFIFLK